MPDTRPAPTAWQCGDHVVDLSRPRTMGIVNVTPDSFSDGGRYLAADAAIAHAHALIAEGADLIDLGAESTRPGAEPVSPDAEWSRLEPVLRALRDGPVPLSIDTRHPATMRRALDAGAAVVNDISGFGDADSIAAIRDSACGLVVMHMQGDPRTMQVEPAYDDVVGEVVTMLESRVRRLESAGIAARRIVVDPGFGFGKNLAHNLRLANGLDRLVAAGRPVLVGVSRKGMIGAVTGRPQGERLAGSLAAALHSVARGARIVRVHDVAATVDALRMWWALDEADQEQQRPPAGADRRPSIEAMP